MAENNNSLNSGNRIADGPTSGIIQSSIARTVQNRPANAGNLDPHGAVRLRIGIIDNPTITRQSGKQIVPYDPKDVINLTTGNVTIRWMEQDGGVVRPESFGTYKNEGEDDDRESIKLTHPMIWANGDNWCGVNYLPPVGSIVIVGFRKHNIPVILGYIQSHYQIVNDYSKKRTDPDYIAPVELGEMMNKGYGNNTSHWKMSDEQEHKAWVIEGQSRPVKHLKDQPGRKYEFKPSPHTVGLRLRLKAGIDPFKPGDEKEIIEMYAYRSKGGVIQEHSMVEIRPEMVRSWSESPVLKKSRTEEIITPEYTTHKAIKLNSPAVSYTTWTPGNIRMHATGVIKMTAGKIYLN